MPGEKSKVGRLDPTPYGTLEPQADVAKWRTAFGLLQQRMFTLEQRTASTPRIDDMARQIYDIGQEAKELSRSVASLSDRLANLHTMVNKLKGDLYAREAADAAEEMGNDIDKKEVETSLQSSDETPISEMVSEDT